MGGPGSITIVLCYIFYVKMKKRGTQTQPSDTPVEQRTTLAANDQSPRIAEVAVTVMTNARRAPHHLSPIAKPPSYSDAIIAPPPYQGADLVGRPSYASYHSQPTMNMQENEYASTGYFKPEVDNTDNLATPSQDRLYEELGSTQLYALPDIARPENLPSVT